MKKVYLSLSMLGLYFVLTSSVFLSENMNFKFLKILDEEEIPVLPSEPYDYAGIEFPDFVGEQMGLWDPTFDPTLIVENIDNDIATLGRVLFYDKKLSVSNEVSCGSCHKQAFSFADDAQFSVGEEGVLTTRNSPNLNDIEWATSNNFFFFGVPMPNDGDHFLFWDGKSNVLEDMVLRPINNFEELGEDLNGLPEKLGDTEYYPELFTNAFGDPEITRERMGSAIAHFVRSMISFNSKFDRVQMGLESFTPEEESGFQLFETRCGFTCHITPHFGSGIPMNNGLDEEYEDQGAGAWTNIEELNGAFKSPSLRNVEVTAPYMHDGRFSQLEQVIEFYSEGVQSHPNSAFNWTQGQSFTGFNFTAENKADLMHFMKTLTDHSFLEDPKFSDPFQAITNLGPEPLEESIKVYPNPLESATTVEIENPNGLQFSLQLTTMEGKVLRNVDFTGSQYNLDMSNYSAGVYLLEISREGKKTVKRLMMQ